MSKTLFLVTSAMSVSTGDFTQRFAETLSTINSINNKFKNCDIWVLESGRPIEDKALKYFPPNVRVITFWKDSNVIGFMEDATKYADDQVKKYIQPTWKGFYLNYIKNVTESYVIDQVLNSNDFSQYSRIFKLSGRYCLSPNFDPQLYIEKNKFTAYKAVKTNQRKSSIDHFYLCFLWSCCGEEIDMLKNLFKSVKKDVREYLDKREFIDIEHALYLNLTDDKKHEINALGIYAKINGEKWIFV